MNSLRHVWLCALATILCGCSGLPAERAISLRLSPHETNETNHSLSPLQLRELDDLLKITDATLLRHEIGCAFKESESDPSKWEREGREIFGIFSTVREYSWGGTIAGRVYVFWRKPEVRIGLYELGGWYVGSQRFRETYSDLATNIVEKFGASRVKLHKLIL